MQNPTPVTGQRWVSDSEPELGLGIILSLQVGRVEILFPASGEQRLYALSSSPLRRVVFREGDRIKVHSGEEYVVESVEEQGGLLTYHSGDRLVEEAELSDTISFSSPKERLLAGQVSNLKTYNLRAEALDRWSRILGSSVRGYVGGRIDIIPHQLSIAVEVCSRLTPRVLLADEVGLGKTIEAGLILHRLHLTGRANRILIIVPEPLVHQWFVEMLRRFNLSFTILDEERCSAIEENQADINPFLEQQLVLCGVELLTDTPRRTLQALEGEWDLMIVDEAHHLGWSRTGSDKNYDVVEALAARVPGLLLLTATPQQLGLEGHFARLRLLDPERYVDLDSFLEETHTYERVAHAIDSIIEGRTLSSGEQDLFRNHSERIGRRLEEMMAGKEGGKERLIEDLLDSFGPGRVMFRNTRLALSGFPERKAFLYPLNVENPKNRGKGELEWLVEKLKSLGEEKVLLICHSAERAEEIYQYLQLQTRLNSALFHEGLTLIQRDRNAAHFAEPEGAQILICSEIGSEGRNFQFAHDLILFDLPKNPDLLEQRIGRLDRIGQKETVKIHVPYIPGTSSEVLAFWYDEGLNAFEENLNGAEEIARTLRDDLEAVLQSFSPEKLAALIQRSVEEREKIAGRLAEGYDRLLALSSNKPERAAETARHIRSADADRSFEHFFLRLLDYFGVYVEELSNRTYLFRPDMLLTDEFPPFPSGGMRVTFDRTRGLSREDLEFMTADHPFVLSVIELFLKGEEGNTSFGVWEKSGEEKIYIEALVILESVAPPQLHVERFLPPKPMRIIVDHRLQLLSDEEQLSSVPLAGGDVRDLLDRSGITATLLPAMIDATLDFAEERSEAIIADSIVQMSQQLQREIERLEDLGQINNHITPDEIRQLRERELALREAIGTARLRVDSLKVILKSPREEEE
ncbi:MAG: DEAD/DEAH box helicase family protein [Ignavibacteriae bacterium]|nr:DEAD/DEAH box helicase family protein [Ignavibacteriota bacterium]MCB9215892.1 DEAD/DEAH box helicase family protein [Ignavibacteria bacterium]